MRRLHGPWRTRSRSWASAAALALLLPLTSGCSPTTPEAEQPAAASTSEPVEDGLDATLPAAPAPTEPLDDAGVERRTATLRERVIPPEGTARRNVDAVYGEPRVAEWKAGMKGHPSLHPMHVYDLLPPRGRTEFRAFLHVTYRDDRVVRAGINHATAIKGRPAGVPGQEAELRAEKRRVLVDLEEIAQRYRTSLAKAAWTQNGDSD